MQKIRFLLLTSALFLAVQGFGQDKKPVKDTAKKDTTAKTVVPLPPQAPKYYYMIVPAENWNRIMQMLRKSRYPSDEVDEVINGMQANIQEWKPPAPTTDSTTQKKK